MLALTKEERLVLISLGAVAVLGLSCSYLLKVSPIVRDMLSITDHYEKYLRLDINTISYEELVAIPRLGPQLAKRILLYRQENGDFSRIDDLRNIDGVGSFKMKTIEKYLKVGP